MSGETLDRRELLKRAALLGAGVAAARVGAGSASAQEAADGVLHRVPRRKLGHTGETVPVLMMGGAQRFDPVFDKMLHRAFDLGIDHIETSEGYRNGQSHVTLRPFIEQVGRKNLWITSQSGMFGGDGPAPVSMYRDAIMKEYAVLGTDYLDAYFLFGLKHPECLEPEYLRFADELKKSGKARYFGFSCHDSNVVELMNKAATLGGDAINMILFRYSFRAYGDIELNKAMDACVAAGIGLIGMKTQSSVPADDEQVRKLQSGGLTLYQARLRVAVDDERLAGCVSGINSTPILMENVQAVLGAKALSV